MGGTSEVLGMGMGVGVALFSGFSVSNFVDLVGAISVTVADSVVGFAIMTCLGIAISATNPDSVVGSAASTSLGICISVTIVESSAGSVATAWFSGAISVTVSGSVASSVAGSGVVIWLGDSVSITIAESVNDSGVDSSVGVSAAEFFAASISPVGWLAVGVIAIYSAIDFCGSSAMVAVTVTGSLARVVSIPGAESVSGGNLTSQASGLRPQTTKTL